LQTIAQRLSRLLFFTNDGLLLHPVERIFHLHGQVGHAFFTGDAFQFNQFHHDFFGCAFLDQRKHISHLLYQNIIGTDAHKFRTGFSLSADRYNEQYKAQPFRRKEVVPGGFFEYTFAPGEKFSAVAGLRADYNNLFGLFATPRLNLRYEPVSGTVVRVNAGRGQRTANIFAENIGALVSSRTVNILGATAGKAYGLDPEVAWNKGVSVDQKLKLFGREATASVDFFRTDFTNQVVVDYEDPRQVQFYNLNGKSYSNSLQAELDVTPVKSFDVRLAYRWFDVKTTYGNDLLQKPLTAKNRAFANLAYELKDWKFDYTVNLVGQKRIPSTEGNPKDFQLAAYSPNYVTMNAQVSKSFGKSKTFEWYLGGENLTNYFQQNVILSAGQPFSPYFDASLIWGQVTGRQLYTGFRYKLK